MTANSIDDQSPQPLTIYTIGHSNVPASKIVELLKSQGIKVLVDVRSSPYSKYVTQFNREMFQSTLKQAGIDYKFAGEYLGGRPKDPTCYKSGQLPAGHVDFLHEVDYPAVMTKEWYQKGINRLLEIASEARTAFMCSEEDPARCHRQHLISQTLLQQGIQVLHIRGNGLLQKAWLIKTPAAKAEEKPVEQPNLLTEIPYLEGAKEDLPCDPELEYEPIEDGMMSSFFPDFINPVPAKTTNSKKSKQARSKEEAASARKQAELDRLQKWIEKQNQAKDKE